MMTWYTAFAVSCNGRPVDAVTVNESLAAPKVLAVAWR
jgi:hypothetical protein